MAGNYPQRFGSGPAFPKRFPAPSQNPQHAGALGQNRHPHTNYPPNSGGQVIGGMDRVGIFAQFDSSGSAESASSGQSWSSASSTTNSSQAYVTSSSSGAQTVIKSRSHEPQGQGSDWQSGADRSQGGKQLSSEEDQGVERADNLIKGSKTGTSLSDFLNKSKKAKKAGVSSGPSVTVSKVSLSEFIWDRDSGKSWDDIKEKFGLTNDESGAHLINMDQPKSDTNTDQKTYDGNNTNNNTAKTQPVKTNMTTTSQSEAGTTKTGSIRSDQSESDVIQTGQSNVEAEEISLSDFIWDHESGKSWESIKEKFGLNSDESVLLPVETNTNRSGGNTPLKRAVGDSKQSKAGGPNPKVLKTSLESVSSSNQQGSREPLKRKSGLGDGDGAKKQKMSTRLAVQGEYPEWQRQTCLHGYQPGQTKCHKTRLHSQKG